MLAYLELSRLLMARLRPAFALAEKLLASEADEADLEDSDTPAAARPGADPQVCLRVCGL